MIARSQAMKPIMALMNTRQEAMQPIEWATKPRNQAVKPIKGTGDEANIGDETSCPTGQGQWQQGGHTHMSGRWPSMV